MRHRLITISFHNPFGWPNPIVLCASLPFRFYFYLIRIVSSSVAKGVNYEIVRLDDVCVAVK